jgi:hypothetical protein
MENNDFYVFMDEKKEINEKKRLQAKTNLPKNNVKNVIKHKTDT